jgi:hypothetical protein
MSKRNFFRSSLQALVEARTREAENLVARFEATNGYSKADRIAGRAISAGY